MIAIDLFSGVGGMSLGFETAGFDVRFAADIDPRHTQMYKVNFPGTKVLTASIRDLTGDIIIEACNNEKEIDVVFGGPPCQGFSVAGKGRTDDIRNDLFLHFARIVTEIRPKIFIAENVSGILSNKHKDTIEKFYDTLRSSGYFIQQDPFILNAKEFGVPQSRKRVFFVGALKQKWLPQVPQYQQDLKIGKKLSPTVQDAIFDFPALEDLEYLFSQDLLIEKLGEPSEYARLLRIPKSDTLHQVGISGFLRTHHSEVVKQRFNSTIPGTRENISKFHRLDWKGVAPTLRAGTTRANGQFMAPRPIHPVEARCITIREAARLHSYPDWFEFYPTKWYGFMQIGNSVPPFLAQAVAKSLIDAIA